MAGSEEPQKDLELAPWSSQAPILRIGNGTGKIPEHLTFPHPLPATLRCHVPSPLPAGRRCLH